MAEYVKQCNIEIDCGADFAMSFTVTDDAGNVVDLTGATVTAKLREDKSKPEYVEITATHNTTGGVISLGIARTTTATIPYRAGVYDVFVTYSDTTKDKVLFGSAIINHSVTR